MQVKQTIMITAAPAIIMQYLIVPDKLVSWQSLLSKAEQLTNGEVQNGTQFALELNISSQFPQAKRVLDELSFELVGEVLDYVPEQQVSITGESSINTITIKFQCEPEDGRTRVIQETALDFQHPVLKSLAPLARGLLKRQIKADLANLKNLAEQES